jgi:type VII secretion integral membrane protein EccD
VTTQTAVSSGEVCRLSVYGPTSRIELAVPAHVPLADLLPTFLGHLGQELATTGLEHGGWVLQRVGEPPLEEDLGTAALGLLDGDMLYLRPRNDQLPPVDFDDLVDGVATGIGERRDAWRPEHTRRLSLLCMALALVLGLVVTATVGTGSVVALVAGTSAVLLVLGMVAAARAYGDAGIARILGYVCAGYAGLAGLAVPAAGAPFTVGTALFTAEGLMAGGAFVTTTAIAAQVALGGRRPGLLAVTVVAALSAAGGLTAATTTMSGSDVAACVLPFALLWGYLTPGVAARMAGLRVPPLPVTPEEFQQGIEPEPAGPLLDRTALADAYVTAFFVGLAVVITACLVLIAPEPGRSAPLLVVATAVLVMLHSRELVGARQRLAMLAPGALGLAVLLFAAAVEHGPQGRFLVLAAASALALACAVASRTMPGRRLLPHWGLAGDVGHWVVAGAIIPLALAVAGAYTRARGLWS